LENLEGFCFWVKMFHLIPFFKKLSTDSMIIV